MALTRDAQRMFRGAVNAPDILLAMCATDIIYLHAALTDTGGAGVAGPCVGTEAFMGFAMQHVENTGAAGTKKVLVRRQGSVRLTIAGTLAQTDVGVTVYASDDGTFTKTSTSNCAIGKLEEFISTTEGWVHFEAVAVQSL